MKYVSTACGDGNLRIYDIDTQKLVKEINCVPKINTFYAAKVLCKYRIAFVNSSRYQLETTELGTVQEIQMFHDVKIRSA